MLIKDTNFVYTSARSFWSKNGVRIKLHYLHSPTYIYRWDLAWGVHCFPPIYIGYNKLGGLVINTYHINHRGRDFLDSPTPLGLPAPPSRWGQKAGDEIGKNTKKQPTTTR